MGVIGYLFLYRALFQWHDKGRKQAGVCFYILKAFYMIDFFKMSYLQSAFLPPPWLLLQLLYCVQWWHPLRCFLGYEFSFKKGFEEGAGFFPLHGSGAEPNWVSHSDCVQRLSCKVYTEYESAKRTCLNKSSLITVFRAIYFNFKTALTFILYLQDWHPLHMERSFHV